MNLNRNLIKTGLAIVVLMAVAAIADDFNPPDWRGQDGTTFQYWEFLTDESEHVEPDGPGPMGGDAYPSEYAIFQPDYPPVGYLPSTEIISINGYWIPEDPRANRVGIWALSGMMDVIVDNYDPWNVWKIMWVQLTWRPKDEGATPILENFDPEPAPDYQPTVVNEIELPAGWFSTTYTWRISCNPPDESFRISGNIDVDELVIDTWCVPEPATVAMLGLGLIPLLAGTRKK